MEKGGRSGGKGVEVGRGEEVEENGNDGAKWKEWRIVEKIGNGGEWWEKWKQWRWKVVENNIESGRSGNGGEKLGEGVKSGRSRRGGKWQRGWRVEEKGG